MKLSCVAKMFNGVNFTDEVQLAEGEELCIGARSVEYYGEAVMRKVIYIFAGMLMIISIFGKIRENYKWIVLHSASLTLVMTIYYEIVMSIPEGTPYSEYPEFIMVTYIYINRMSIGSLLPLAINRFFRLYFDHYYNRIFGGFKLFIFLFGYDLVLCIYAHIQTLFPYNNNLEIAFCVSIMSLSIVMAIGILFKIRQMNKLAKKSVDTSTLKDLQRAAIVCFVQGIALCIYFSLVSISQSFYLRIVIQPKETPNILFRIVLVLYPFYTFMYLTSMLIDAILLLLVLKTYERV